MKIANEWLQAPALVVRAEAKCAWMKLPGIEEFTARLKAQVRDAREKSAVGRLLAWETIQQCYEYGNRAEVRARVAAMNTLADGSSKNGRPYSGHRLAMEAIAARCALNFRTVERWQANFNRAVNSGELKPGELNSLGEFSPSQVASRIEEIEARLGAKERGTASPPEEHEPEARETAAGSHSTLSLESYGKRLANRFLRKARLLDGADPALMLGVLKALAPVLEQYGYCIVREGGKRSTGPARVATDEAEPSTEAN
ncbi:MAG: hypothetical protein ABSE73_08390 [Planctomycetota bacterium]